MQGGSVERDKSSRKLKLILLLAVVPLLAAVPALAAEVPHGHRSQPVVLPPWSHPYGKSYGEWSAVWWQYIASVPKADNPLLDDTGAKCGVQQSGPVFFLGGAYTRGGDEHKAVADRTQCTVPAGKALFFPILNTWCLDPDYWENGCKQPMDQVTGMFAEVDGKKIEGLDSATTKYRVTVHGFTMNVPKDNIFGDPTGGVWPNRAGDGVYLMLAPMRPGPHTIHFGGKSPAFNFELDVTYHLTVAG
jgi:hypothetical protein